MLFSIIIPMFNIENYIVPTLRSICANELYDCELVLIDNDSSDQTICKAQEYLKENSKCPYRIHRQEDRGVSVSRNVGIQLAKGKYIIFCDGDDFFEPELISTVRLYLQKEPELVAWRYYITQGEKREVSQEPEKELVLSRERFFEKFLLGESKMRIGSFAIRADVLQKHEICFTHGCNFAEDVEFMFKSIAKVESVVFLNDILFTYAKRTGSVVYSYRIDRFDSVEAMERVYEYVQADDKLMEKEKVSRYLKNSLYILHAIFSFDACIKYLKWNEVFHFYKEYRKKYPGLEQKINCRLKDLDITPNGISNKKLFVFKMGRILYMLLYTIRK